MNNLMQTLLISAFTLSTYSAFAADQTNNQTNTEDAKEGLVQDDAMNQPMEQSTGADSKQNSSGKKNMAHKNRKGSHSTDYKVMDSNSDGMISKDEYMMHHEAAYGNMKQTNGSVSLKDMNAQMNVGTTKGNKIQPSNVKDAPPEARPEARN